MVELEEKLDKNFKKGIIGRFEEMFNVKAKPAPAKKITAVNIPISELPEDQIPFWARVK
jgi:hypothetical protein